VRRRRRQMALTFQKIELGADVLLQRRAEVEGDKPPEDRGIRKGGIL